MCIKKNFGLDICYLVSNGKRFNVVRDNQLEIFSFKLRNVFFIVMKQLIRNAGESK